MLVQIKLHEFLPHMLQMCFGNTYNNFFKNSHHYNKKNYVIDYTHYFMLIITLNILMYWVILKMENFIKFFHIKNLYLKTNLHMV
jgi:hypothetical protein